MTKDVAGVAETRSETVARAIGSSGKGPVKKPKPHAHPHTHGCKRTDEGHFYSLPSPRLIDSNFSGNGFSPV